jgi:hypothetical protein
MSYVGLLYLVNHRTILEFSIVATHDKSSTVPKLSEPAIIVPKKKKKSVLL